MNLEELFESKNPSKANDNIVIVDFSNLLHSSFHAQVRFDKSLESNFEKYAMWRYILLNQIVLIKTKLQPTELILAIDSSSWREKEFKYYKAKRKLDRENQKDFDYEEFIQTANQFIEQIESTFPYKVIKYDNAEADDVIGVLATLFAEQNKNCTIVSRDKDFKQLLKYNNIKFYDPIDKEFKEVKDPFGFLFDHISGGDTSDGIPNILSDDNTFVDSTKRQKRMTKKVKEQINDLGIEKYCIENGLIQNYERNKKLIDLSKIPEDIVEGIKYEYNNAKPQKPNFMKVAAFFKKYKIKSLEDKVDQFL